MANEKSVRHRRKMYCWGILAGKSFLRSISKWNKFLQTYNNLGSCGKRSKWRKSTLDFALAQVINYNKHSSQYFLTHVHEENSKLKEKLFQDKDEIDEEYPHSKKLCNSSRFLESAKYNSVKHKIRSKDHVKFLQILHKELLLASKVSTLIR